jgi:AAA+ superfamily predicted ATPase
MTAPCIVVLEDLDAMINEENRAFFLNELDGFQINKGVVVLATTNHPEKLDSAILDRPSRFDRKYNFNLPGERERTAYLEHWNKQLQAEIRLTDAGTSLIVSRTEGFSFAYLKELVMSSMVQWISSDRARSMNEIGIEQAESLRNQMAGNVRGQQTANATRFKLLKRAANLMAL